MAQIAGVGPFWLAWVGQFSEAAKYLKEHAAVIDLYDKTNSGPHDTVEPIDVLAPNALNAFIRVKPMTPMAELWAVRSSFEPLVAQVSKQPFETMTDDELRHQRKLLVDALSAIERTRHWGGTRTAKFMHRLRPNIMPIWDQFVGRWYDGESEPWDSYIRKVHADVKVNYEVLGEIGKALPERLVPLRLWDILWKTQYDGTQPPPL